MLSQNETKNWYFGNKAAIKFENGRIINLDDSEMDAPANCTSISDENGQLMFYSDGATVWNRNHEIMKFGTGLIGQTSHYQSVIIVPKPNSNKIYYLIYTRSESVPSLAYNPGTYYSEIEFNTENPLGIVNTKNFILNSNSPSEKLTAVHHRDGKSFWLLTLNAADEDNSSPKKIFNLFKINETGINTTPVEIIAEEEIENLGVMKFSPNGKKLAISANATNDGLKKVSLYSFNNETGELTFGTILIINQGLALFPSNGIEFSPNGKYMYISISNGTRLVQYEMNDLEFGDEPKTYLFSSSNSKIESLQIGNDQKIYVALHDEEEGNDFLGVIEYPDEKGTLANYRHNAIRLSPGASKRGLPNFIQSFFASKITTQNVCFTDEFSFSASSFGPVTAVSWDFGDGTSATGINATHTYSSPGSYNVKAILTVGSQNITVYKLIRAYELPVLTPNQELVECDEDLDGRSTFNLLNIREKILNRGSTDITDFYLNPSDLNKDITISNPENFQNTDPNNQQIFVKATNENGCFETSSFIVRTRFVQLDDIDDVFVCEDSDGITGNAKGEFDTLTLETSIRNQLSLASSLRLSFYPTFNDAQTSTNRYTGRFTEVSKTIYLKIIEVDGGCGGIKAFNIVVNNEPKINLQEVYTICYVPTSKPPIVLSGDISNERFEWKDSAGNITRTRNFTLNSVGEFSLTVYKTENNLLCSNTKTFQVVNPTIPEFSQIIVNTEDETNNIIEVFISGNSLYEFSLDNINFSGSSNSFTFSNVVAGLRTVFVRDINSCEEPIQRTVSVIGYKKYFTPNSDGDNDYWNIKGLDSGSFKSINVSIFDRYGKVIAKINDFTSDGWDGSFNGKNLPANNFWFISEIVDKDNNVIKKSGNFSLIRN